MVMGLDRGTLNALMLAATAGLAIGGVAGVVSPSFAEAVPSDPRSRPPATVVTDVDVLTGDHMSITVRFSNTGPGVRHLAATDISVVAGSVVLLPRTPGATDIRPGATVTSMFVFDTPPAGASLTLLVPGEALPL